MGETMYFFNCDYCGIPSEKRLVDFKRKDRASLKRDDGVKASFCSLSCMSRWREDYYDRTGLRQERIEDLLVDRFWAKVDKTPGQGPDGTCWEWTGARFRKTGYGKFSWRIGRHKEQARIASRAYYINILKQDIKGKNVLHKCDNPPCVNPEHLYLGTQKDNSDDKVRKKRHLFGETAKSAKLTEKQVLEARRLAKEREGTTTKIALGVSLVNEMGLPVSPETLVNILNGHSWKHLLDSSR